MIIKTITLHFITIINFIDMNLFVRAPSSVYCSTGQVPGTVLSVSVAIICPSLHGHMHTDKITSPTLEENRRPLPTMNFCLTSKLLSSAPKSSGSLNRSIGAPG